MEMARGRRLGRTPRAYANNQQRQRAEVKSVAAATERL